MNKGVNVYSRFYWGDYLKDTRHLSPEEHGTYLLLLAAYYTKSGPLPDDDTRLAKLVQCPVRRWVKRLRPVMEEFFTIENGVWVQKRCEREIAGAMEGKRKKKIGAALTNAKRWNTPVDPSLSKSHSDSFEVAERPESESLTGRPSTVNRQPSVYPREKKRGARRRQSGMGRERFRRWISSRSWPRRRWRTSIRGWPGSGGWRGTGWAGWSAGNRSAIR